MKLAIVDKYGAAWIGISQVTLLISNLILLKMLTDGLTAFEFGQYALFMSVALFIRQVLYDPFSMITAKECASFAIHESIGFRVTRLITDRVCVLLLLIATLSLIYIIWADRGVIEGLFIVTCLVYVFSNGAQGFYFNVLNSIRARKHAALFSIIDSAAKILLVFLAFSFFDNSIAFSVLPISISCLILFLLLRYFVLRHYKLPPHQHVVIEDVAKKIVIMSVPFFVPTILAAVKSVGDRWLLAGYLGVEELGGYSVLLQIGYLPVMLLVGMAQTFVAPKIYGFCSVTRKKSIEELKIFLNKLLFFILIGTCLAAFISVALADWVFGILVASAYHGLTVYLPFFVVSGALSAAAAILQIAIIGVLDSRSASILLAFSLIIGVAVAVILIYFYGFDGAVAALVMSAIVTLSMYRIYLYRAIKLRLDS